MFPEYVSKFPELGFYGLPGHTRTPGDILAQVQDAEALGLGNVMISERADYKEIGAICGAVAAVTNEIFIGTSATNLNKRHPTVTASLASTMNRLSEGRFALGPGERKPQKMGFHGPGSPDVRAGTRVCCVDEAALERRNHRWLRRCARAIWRAVDARPT